MQPKLVSKLAKQGTCKPRGLQSPFQDLQRPQSPCQDLQTKDSASAEPLKTCEACCQKTARARKLSKTWTLQVSKDSRARSKIARDPHPTSSKKTAEPVRKLAKQESNLQSKGPERPEGRRARIKSCKAKNLASLKKHCNLLCKLLKTCKACCQPTFQTKKKKKNLRRKRNYEPSKPLFHFLANVLFKRKKKKATRERVTIKPSLRLCPSKASKALKPRTKPPSTPSALGNFFEAIPNGKKKKDLRRKRNPTRWAELGTARLGVSFDHSELRSSVNF